jgi:hypothetical protein
MTKSKRGQVRAHFQLHGIDQAIIFGATLGIGEAKVRRWCKLWTKPPVGGSSARRRVWVHGATNLRGFVIHEGPEQTEVKLDNGWTQVFMNDHLRTIRPKAK